MAVVYVVYDLITVNSAIENLKPTVRYVTGTSYMLLMSVFFLFSAIEYAGAKNKLLWVRSYSNQLVIGWFIATLILAYFIPVVMQSRLEKAGYVACDNPQVISRVSRGKSLIFVHKNAFPRPAGGTNGQAESVCHRFVESMTRQK
ncbi:hypothetical protein I4W93_013540 [Rheinheimera sp. MA13]|uniref:DUF1240 domain-containing protein n=2 Tax=Rheinheimera maricola TaxID=2793282 RepID=A0ABS7XBA5_9GAMM|nr:hypothetical protein [Rheinheimera maricola]MBZ9612621.1 hypothetical protein [Rheinheimera maricola]